MREHQRLTQDMTDAQRAGLKGTDNVAGVPRVVQDAVRAATARQKRELEDAGAQVLSRAVGRGAGGVPTVGGAANVGARPVTSDSVDRGADTTAAQNRGRIEGIAIGRNAERGRAKAKAKGRP